MSVNQDEHRLAGRARIAVAGARAATGDVFGRSSRRERLGNVVFPALLLLALSVALAGLLAIIVWAVVEGGSRANVDLITNGTSRLDAASAGYREAILGSLYVIGGVILLIVPLGVGAAIYLEEYADKTRWWNRLIELNIQNLAGVPSIVFGILGLAFVVRGPLSLGFVAAAGAITVAMLVLPTVIIAAREAIRAVPPSIREGSLALGATQWQTIRRQVLPAAFSGILTGTILAVARAFGEAAPLLLVGATTFVTFDPSLFENRFTTLPVQIFNYSKQPQEEFQVLAAGGALVMITLLVVVNSFAIGLRNKFERRW
ncbi:phosphate ABC transporter permease PstA [Actinobacteria bacterium YIM 96077]|uniref:Phosphate transport system permease protein PstA n=1 Tax=Phytoactinopolyspora halophila TaxID=1981511 RepID=A0A329R2N0_9ACTN|nr:phosphate ABC transporter permease PstA [Phytoactinopolyspora halophila]AYY11863.1 phosphate ABC transporter permease PstA [Actinobacteria bacterium YIM 96077]RAW18904.1 phosphate ABC transporter permease PtsA [Phytoactinopolyspora halophila]